MRAVLFEGTPEEFARVEAAFRAGGDPALLTRSIVLPQSRPKAWPELDEEQCHRLARRVLEQAPARLVEALSALAESQDLVGDQTIEDWAHQAGRLPEELAGMLAELARCASRAFIELFGCESAPQRVRGAADMLVQKVRSEEGAYFVIRPGLMRAMAELHLIDPLSSSPEQGAEAGGASEPRPAAGAPRPSPPVAEARPSTATLPPACRPLAAPSSKPASPLGSAVPRAPRPPIAPGGILGELARLLTPLAESAGSGAPAARPAAEENSSPAPPAKRERNPFSLLDWADLET